MAEQQFLRLYRGGGGPSFNFANPNWKDPNATDPTAPPDAPVNDPYKITSSQQNALGLGQYANNNNNNPKAGAGAGNKFGPQNSAANPNVATKDFIKDPMKTTSAEQKQQGLGGAVKNPLAPPAYGQTGLYKQHQDYFNSLGSIFGDSGFDLSTIDPNMPFLRNTGLGNALAAQDWGVASAKIIQNLIGPAQQGQQWAINRLRAMGLPGW